MSPRTRQLLMSRAKYQPAAPKEYLRVKIKLRTKQQQHGDAVGDPQRDADPKPSIAIAAARRQVGVTVEEQEADQ